MKRILALILAMVAVCTLFTACAKNDDDAKYITDKGELVIGITYFEPMNYMEGDKLTGFETEFATEVCKILGVTPKFQEIVWKSKEIELNGKTIDCIWNGMTIDEDRKASMSISDPYMKNKQVLVVKSENAGKYTDAASLKGAKIVAEMESAGETVAKENELFKEASYTPVDKMSTAIMEVAAGTADGCLVDYVTSIGMIGEGTSYKDLVVVDKFAFSEEEYGIAFRKGSNMTAKVNEAIDELIKNGKLEEIAKKYKLDAQLIKD